MNTKIKKHTDELKYRCYHLLLSNIITVIVIYYFVEDFFIFFFNNFNFNKNIIHEHDVNFNEEEIISFIMPDFLENYDFLIVMVLVINITINLPLILVQLWLFQYIGLTKIENAIKAIYFSIFIIFIYTYIHIFKNLLFPLIIEDLCNFENYKNMEQIIFIVNPDIKKIIIIFFKCFISFFLFIYFNMFILLNNINILKYIKRKKLIYIYIFIYIYIINLYWYLFFSFILFSLFIHEIIYIYNLIQFGRSRIRTYDDVNQ